MESQEQEPSEEQVVRSKPPIKLLVSRGYTVIVLLISIILFFTVKNTDKKIQDVVETIDPHAPPAPNSKPPTFKISDLGSLRSVLSASVIGAACNLIQLGMLIYCTYTNKDMSRNKYKIFFDYYSDKVVSLLLAASAGAGIGAMLDIKQVRPSFKYVGSFFSLGQISTTLLATSIVSTSVSSTSSTESMQEYKKTIEKGEKAAGFIGTWATKAYNCCCMRC